MYNEITPRIFLGGYVSREVNANVLYNAGVTHIVNSSHKALPQLVKQQFYTLEMVDSDQDFAHGKQYWAPVFDFTRKALQKHDTKVYFHILPDARPQSPVALYAGLRALGYSDIRARQTLSETHPILQWQEIALQNVRQAFDSWCKQRHVHPSLPGRKDSEENNMSLLQAIAAATPEAIAADIDWGV